MFIIFQLYFYYKNQIKNIKALTDDICIFAVRVAPFGMVLWDSDFLNRITLEDVIVCLKSLSSITIDKYKEELVYLMVRYSIAGLED